jgi:D-alanyl-lipoteichoic acid acyltransferase DltB (MBOAT superfamily)
MLFNSTAFLFGFLPITVILYWLIVRRHVPAAMLFLAFASYFFLLYGEPTYPFLLAVSILFNYLCGLGIRRSGQKLSRLILIAGLAGDLLALGYFKYTNFLVSQTAALLHLSHHSSIVLPLGISFYTFTQIAYLVDTYRTQASEGNIARYFLFVSYFPHLIAGPIIHHKEMMPQFLRPRLRAPGVSIFSGLVMFAIGLAKKVLIADPCAQAAANIWGPAASGVRMPFADSWVAALSYTFQIYFDFSGYSDMAIGISMMFGLRLPINFNSPYKSLDLIDFWRRWHISLSRFLRDYIYIPLGGNRHGKVRRYLNLVVTMVIGGIWHGAGWTFLIWGTLHGVVLFFAQLWRDRFKSRFVFPGPRLGWLLTFLFVVFAWVPFRSPSLATSLNLWAGMVGIHGVALPDTGMGHRIGASLHLPLSAAHFAFNDLTVVLVAMTLAVFAPNSQQILRRFRPGLDSPGYRALAPSSARWSFLLAGINWKTALIAGALLALAARRIGSYSEFIYFHF